MDSKIDWSQAPKTELTMAKHLDFFARGERDGKAMRMAESQRPANQCAIPSVEHKF
jgi:hypothetical protein